MKKTMTTLVLLLGLALSSAPAANAQAVEPSKVFVNANVGAQLTNRAFIATQTFELYAETGTATTALDVGAGILADVSVGYRVSRALAFSLGGSYFSTSSDADVLLTVPHPVFSDTLKTVQTTADGVGRTETALHLQALWSMSVGGNITIALAAGPSLFRLRQELATSASAPAGTQDAVPVLTNQSANGPGFNAGIDVSYPLTERYGVGGFVRYAGGNVDLPSAPDEKVGGLQVGAGIRIDLF